MTRDEFAIRAEEANQAHIARWKALMAKDGDDLDDDGYPTDLACERIKAWHWSDKSGWMAYVKSMWHLAEWGWTEKEEPHDYRKDEVVHRFHVSTAGWSGNETLIRSMKEATFLWGLVWVQSRRGGHYIFEIDREITE